MKVGKHRKAKRAIEFFTVNCDFRQPYKVLLDGNFVYSALQLKLDLKERIADLLHTAKRTAVQLLVTPCVLHELQSLDGEFAEACAWVDNSTELLACQHSTHPLSPDDCIRSIVGEDNAGHFFVGSQDKSLRESLGQVKGGASLFLTVNGIHITPPSHAQLQLAEEGVAQDMLPARYERHSAAMAELGKADTVKTSSKFKRKKAKGPNPLSVKKSVKKKLPAVPKRKNENQQQQQLASGADKRDSGKGAKKRKRNKRKKEFFG